MVFTGSHLRQLVIFRTRPHCMCLRSFSFCYTLDRTCPHLSQVCHFSHQAALYVPAEFFFLVNWIAPARTSVRSDNVQPPSCELPQVAAWQRMHITLILHTFSSHLFTPHCMMARTEWLLHAPGDGRTLPFSVVARTVRCVHDHLFRTVFRTVFDLSQPACHCKSPHSPHLDFAKLKCVLHTPLHFHLTRFTRSSPLCVCTTPRRRFTLLDTASSARVGAVASVRSVP